MDKEELYTKMRKMFPFHTTAVSSFELYTEHSLLLHMDYGISMIFTFKDSNDWGLYSYKEEPVEPTQLTFHDSEVHDKIINDSMRIYYI